jgi:hypothetical protein
MNFKNKSSIILSVLFTFSSAHGITMTGDGLGTEHGFIEWVQLIKFPSQMNALQDQVHDAQCHISSLQSQIRIMQAITLLAAGALIYMKWFKNQTPSHISHELAHEEPETAV